MLGPIIEGDLITLAPLEREHLPDACRWSRDPDGIRYLSLAHPLEAKEEEKWYEGVVAATNTVIWAILREGRHIGSTGLHEIDWRNRHAVSGIWIGDTTQHGKGFGREAMRLRTDYAFQELGLEKVVTIIQKDNTASRRAAESAGYRQCGLWKRHIFRQGRWHDVWLGEVLRDDWLAARRPSGPEGE